MGEDSETKFVLALQQIFEIFETELSVCETVQYKRPTLIVNEPQRKLRSNKRWRNSCLKNGSISFNNQ